MDVTAYLPDGSQFDFWEREQEYTGVLHVKQGRFEGEEKGDGSVERPFGTIQEAAEAAEPGQKVLIHAGVYREWVHPVRGGTDPAHMISYEAFGDGPVVVKASEQVTEFESSTGWRLFRGFEDEKRESCCKIWLHRLNPDMFRGYNPFCAVNIQHDRLFIEYDKTDMTPYLNRRGMVFCDGKPLVQVALYNQLSEKAGSYWVEANGQTVHFRLKDDGNPADHVMEITCREQCFAPDIPFLSYIRVKGITCAHAAGGAPVPQRGALSCYRGHHWVIEDCVIDWSNGVGIDVGNECWHHEIVEGQQIGCSVIRGCTIQNAGVCGIAGLFAEHMLIEDNLIEKTGWQRMELSWEAGAIKLHNSVNGLLRRNIFRDTLRADHLWLDCGNENNRIVQNLFLNGIEQREAIFVECTRDGVNLIDHNVIWNVEGRFEENQIPKEPGSSGWYKMEEAGVVNGYGIYGEGTDHLRIVSNLIGRCRSAGYFSKPVSFRMGGTQRGGTSRDARIVGNVFYDCREAALKLPTKDNVSEGNLYVKELGGYLRILYPTPPVCLHLPAWKEFYGLEKTGQEGWFEIEVDDRELTLRMKPAKQGVPGFGKELERRQYAYGEEDILTADKELWTGAAKIPADILWGKIWESGSETENALRPGPFGSLTQGVEYGIDPRRRKNQ